MKYIVLLSALIVLSACDMEKSFRTNEELSYDIYNQIGRELADDLYFIWEDHYEHEGFKREIRDDVSIYSEEIYLATMKIMESYGIDTNRFHRSTISIKIIGDEFDNANLPFGGDGTIPINVSKLETSDNIAIIKQKDYSKFIEPLMPEREKGQIMHDFVYYTLSNIEFTSPTNAYFLISYTAGFLIARGTSYYISKQDRQWVIDSSKVTWVS